MRADIIRRLLFPAWHWVKQDNLSKILREYDANQWLQSEELFELQQQKLASLLTFARKHVPYYRTLLHGVSPRRIADAPHDELGRLPPLTKRIIQRQKSALVSENLTDNALRNNSTSGSTGEALRFYTDSRSQPYRRAAVLRSDSWTGWRLGDRVVRLWGASIDQKRRAALQGKVREWLTGDLFLNSFSQTHALMDDYVTKIRRVRPDLIVGYAGSLEQFAIHCSDRGVSFTSIKGVISSAETLWPHQRKIVEKVFGAKVFNRYGCREIGHISGECEAHDGLHVNADRLVLEVIDEAGRQCARNEPGRILVTDLDNFGMPLIRYEIGDQGSLSPADECVCGRGLPKLTQIEGRSLEIIRTPDGRRIGGTFWTILLKSRPGLRQVQVIQNELNRVLIHFVRDDDFSREVLDYFKSRIQEHCGQSFGVEFVEKESIDVTGSGKRRLIVSNLDD